MFLQLSFLLLDLRADTVTSLFLISRRAWHHCYLKKSKEGTFWFPAGTQNLLSIPGEWVGRMASEAYMWSKKKRNPFNSCPENAVKGTFLGMHVVSGYEFGSSQRIQCGHWHGLNNLPMSRSLVHSFWSSLASSPCLFSTFHLDLLPIETSMAPVVFQHLTYPG